MLLTKILIFDNTIQSSGFWNAFLVLKDYFEICFGGRGQS